MNFVIKNLFATLVILCGYQNAFAAQPGNGMQLGNVDDKAFFQEIFFNNKRKTEVQPSNFVHPKQEELDIFSLRSDNTLLCKILQLQKEELEKKDVQIKLKDAQVELKKSQIKLKDAEIESKNVQLGLKDSQLQLLQEQILSLKHNQQRRNMSDVYLRRGAQNDIRRMRRELTSSGNQSSDDVPYKNKRPRDASTKTPSNPKRQKKNR